MKSRSLAAASAAFLLSVTAAGDALAGQTYAHPNILLVLVDDMTVDSIDGVSATTGQPFLPFIHSKRASARMFNRHYFSMPVCWTSRASLMTGQYPHNHRINLTDGGTQAYTDYAARQLDKISWPMEMKNLGYSTGNFGKFLNGYGARTLQPGGWSLWFTIGAAQNGSPYNWTANKYGKVVLYDINTTGLAGYSTNVFGAEARRAIAAQDTAYQKPFAFIFAPTAPHLPAVPEPRWTDFYAKEPFQPGRNPDFNELVIEDKPAYVADLPLLSPLDIRGIAVDWRHSLEAGRSIDDNFKVIWRTLEATGKLKNTYIIFASDNGFIFGGHRVKRSKVLHFERSTRSKMYVWGPGVVPGADPRIVSLMDLYATFMEIGGGVAPATVDGRSLLPLLRGENAPWRKQFLVTGFFPADGVTLSPAQAANGTYYRMLVTRTYKVVVHADGDGEFYNLATDSEEIRNLWSRLSPQSKANAKKRIADLDACAGDTCRAIEELPIPVMTLIP